MIRTAVRFLGAMLIVIGVLGCATGFLCALGIDLGIPDSFELPLGDVTGVSVDSRGNIYVGVQFYSRIQVYDMEGKYLRGRFVDASGGAFRMKIGDDDQLLVATARNRRLYTFNKDGSLIGVLSNVGHYFDDFGKIGKTRYRDDSPSVTYAVRHRLTFPAVVKRELGGEETVIIKTPFHRWVLMGPFPAFLLLFVGVSILAVTGKHGYIGRLVGRIRNKYSGESSV